jgi:hypothetical protein
VLAMTGHGMVLVREQRTVRVATSEQRTPPGAATAKDDDERQGNKAGNHELVGESEIERWRALMGLAGPAGRRAVQRRRARTVLHTWR